tara:strand:- start:2125 stop:3321 length:1197 start_codon:yes stop_codon:yes gene_type:complete
MTKSFSGDLEHFKNLITNNVNFAFVRFSDGEVDILKNIKLSLESNRVIEGNKIHNFGYPEDDHKLFDPEQHQFVRKALLDSLRFCKKNYYKGLGDPCCNGVEYTKWLRKLHGLHDTKHLTWSNLFVNGNYSSFLDDVVPLFACKKVVVVCSKNAKLNNLPFNVVKDFRVGKNCIVNDHDLFDDISKWIEENNIEGHMFLFSASSLSEILIHKLFDKFDNNTYLDIGTTLHRHLSLDIARDYLKAYWNNAYHRDLYKICNWLEITYVVDCKEEHWDVILELRNDPIVKRGFIQQDKISKLDHYNFMKKNSENYIVCLRDDRFLGFAGVVDNDIRVAVKSALQGQGCGKYLIKKIIDKFPNSCAKIKKENISSIKIFEANGFSEVSRDETMVYMQKNDVT